MPSQSQEKDEDRAFDQSEDGVVAELLEEVEPKTCIGTEFRNIGVFPTVVVELEDWQESESLFS